MIRFGPAGLGSVKDAISNLEEYHKLGLRACEIAFTYGVYIKNEKEAREIGQAARKLDIKLSIHSPYFVNLNSKEKKKLEASKKRIIDCCKVADWLGAEIVVFHPGYYGKMDKETSFLNIKESVMEMLAEIKRNKWHVKIAAETMGKVNVFGTLDEILRLVKETSCSFCIDFAHLFARSNGKMGYNEMYEKVSHFPELHCHFSGIEFSDKGERHHKLTSRDELKKLISILPKNKNITIINESPNPVSDSALGIKILRGI